jgi:opacity protein-like surface antigen
MDSQVAQNKPRNGTLRHPAFGLFVFVSLIGASQAAFAQSNWYLEGSAGALLQMESTKWTTFFNTLGVTGPGTNTMSFNPGYVFNFGVGYKLPYGFRTEVEGGYAHNTPNSITPVNTNGALPALNGTELGLQSGGSHDQYSGTLSVFYDKPITGWIVPYIGAGVGMYNLIAETAYYTGPGGVPRFTQYGGSITNALLLAEVGATIELDPKWALVPAYRFEKAFTRSGEFPSNANIIKLGLRYSL